jgi:hypothetical protein
MNTRDSGKGELSAFSDDTSVHTGVKKRAGAKRASKIGLVWCAGCLTFAGVAYAQGPTAQESGAATPPNPPPANALTPDTAVTWRGDRITTPHGGFGARVVPGEVNAPGGLEYGNGRQAEDYRYLADPSKRKDYTDPLKYIPLLPDGQTYLTFFGQERAKYQNETSSVFNFPAAPYRYNAATGTYSGSTTTRKNQAENFYLRNDVGADLHVTPYFRALGEIINAESSGRNQGTRGQSATQRNDLAVVQGFGEFDAYWGGAKEQLRVGRQLFNFGWLSSGYSTSPNLWSSSWDGIRAAVDTGAFRLDLFAFSPVVPKTVDGDSTVNQSAANGHTNMWGAYATKVLGPVAFRGTPIKASLDTFYFGTRQGGAAGYPWYNTSVVTNPGVNGVVNFAVGADRRHTVGARYYGSWGNWDFVDAAAYQFGSTNGNKVTAYELHSRAGYHWRAAPWSPWAWLRADVASGGAHRGPGNSTTGGTNEDFLPISESTFPVGFGGFALNSNMITAAPHLLLNPIPNKFFTEFYASPYFRYSQGDAWETHQINGTPEFAALTAFVPGYYIGTLLDWRTTTNIAPHLSFKTEVAYLVAGTVMKNAGSRDQIFAEAEIDYEW